MKGGRTIYGVFANTSYEGGDIVCSFDDRSDAEEYAKKCRDYEDKRPATPDVDAPDADWDAYIKRNANWEKRHPARPYIHRSYDVGSIRHYGQKPSLDHAAG